MEPDSIFAATRIAVSTLRANTSMAVAFIPNYFPKQGAFFEACSSRFSEDSIYTRQIGSAEHDYTEMDVVQAFMGVSTKNFRRTLELIDREFGGMMFYLQNQLLLTKKDIQLLRKRYLE